MNAQKTILNIAVSFAFIFTACGGNSASNEDAQNENTQENTSSADDSNHTRITCKTYEGLLSEQPCAQSIKATIAHISSTNEEYLCSIDESSNSWVWQPYQSGNGTAMGEDGQVYETFMDSRDGRIYKKVTIGSQTWMAENLDFNSNGSLYFLNSESRVEECERHNKGKLYRLSAAIDSAGVYSDNGKNCAGNSYEGNMFLNETCFPVYPMRGVCPEGWHLPDTTEWKTLFNYTNGDLLVKNNSNRNNSFGFSALLIGEYSEGRSKCLKDNGFKYEETSGTATFVTSSINWQENNNRTYFSGLYTVQITHISSENRFSFNVNRGGSLGNGNICAAYAIRCVMD